MIGAIAGDIIGSVHEWAPIKTKEFPLFAPKSKFTDDTVLTVAVADAILNKRDYADVFHEYYQIYRHVGFGPTFQQWGNATDRKPYNSWGNGSAMRVSPVGFAFDTLEEVLAEAKRSAEVTHNHPEGIKGAQAVAAAIFLAVTEQSKPIIRAYLQDTFGYFLDETVNDIRPTYQFDVSCQGTVPQSVIAFLDGTSYEDTIRNAVSMGGDADTMACIAGGIAQAYYGVPALIGLKVFSMLDDHLQPLVSEFGTLFPRGRT